MKIEKVLLFSSVVLFLLTMSWIVLMFLSLDGDPSSLEGLDDAIHYVTDPGLFFYLNYINVVLLTIVNAVFFGFLYLYFRNSNPMLSITGIIFIPVYATYNLFAYASQILIAQSISGYYSSPEFSEQLPLLFSQLVQAWDKSTIAFINSLAYAILGIPSVTFGICFLKGNLLSKIAGWFLIANGLFCIIGLTGLLVSSWFLPAGTMIGGLLYLLFLVILVPYFYRKA
jgi:hypothetical protein